MPENFAQSDAEKVFFSDKRTTREIGEERFSQEALEVAQLEATSNGCSLDGYPRDTTKEIMDTQSFRVMENGKYTGVCYEWENNKWSFPRRNTKFDSLEDALNQVVFDETSDEKNNLEDSLVYASREAETCGCTLEGYPWKKPSRDEIIASGVSWSPPHDFRVMKDSKYTGVVYRDDFGGGGDTWSIPIAGYKKFDNLTDALDFYKQESPKLIADFEKLHSGDEDLDEDIKEVV